MSIESLILGMALVAGDGGAAKALPAAGGETVEGELTPERLKDARLKCYGQDGPDKKPIAAAVWKVWLAEGQAALVKGDAATARDRLVRVCQRGSEEPEAIRSLILAHRAMSMPERERGCALLARHLARHPLQPKRPKKGP